MFSNTSRDVIIVHLYDALYNYRLHETSESCEEPTCISLVHLRPVPYKRRSSHDHFLFSTHHMSSYGHLITSILTDIDSGAAYLANQFSNRPQFVVFPFHNQFVIPVYSPPYKSNSFGEQLTWTNRGLYGQQ